jgi:hypothetical protein
MTTALSRALPMATESHLPHLIRLLKIRPPFVENILPLLVEPTFTKSAQERQPKVFDALVSAIQDIVSSAPVEAATLTAILFTCVQNWKPGDTVMELLQTLLRRGANAVSPDSSSSLMLELCKRNYPRVIRFLIEAELKGSLFGPEPLRLATVTIAMEKMEARMFGWTAQLIEVMNRRVEEESKTH